MLRSPIHQRRDLRVISVSFETDLFRVRPDIRQVICPYTGEQLPALLSIKPDVALIHALAADEQGNAIPDQSA